jgi:hypothetical protein
MQMMLAFSRSVNKVYLQEGVSNRAIKSWITTSDDKAWQRIR